METLWEERLFSEYLEEVEGYTVESVVLQSFKIRRDTNGDISISISIDNTWHPMHRELFKKTLEVHKRKSTNDIPQSLKDHFEALDIIDKIGD